jgi:hypothetical protein
VITVVKIIGLVTKEQKTSCRAYFRAVNSPYAIGLVCIQ